MPDLYLIFNHKATPLQEQDAKRSLRVHRLVALPKVLEKLWNQVPPDLPEITPYLAPIKEWLDENAVKGDYVLIQGDFGATFLMVQYAFEKGLLPVYSTSRREAKEEHAADGSVSMTHRFSHQIYRRYGR